MKVEVIIPCQVCGHEMEMVEVKGNKVKAVCGCGLSKKVDGRELE